MEAARQRLQKHQAGQAATLAASLALSLWMGRLALECVERSSRRRCNRERSLRLKKACEANKRKYRELYGSVREDDRRRILSLSVQALVTAMRNGELKSRDVLEAYIAMAVDVDKRTNAVVVFLDDALRVADQLDQVPKDLRGPLHGLPFSVKEHVWMRGELSTAGLSSFISERVSDCDATLVEALRSLGANAFCRTNLSQGCASIESSNPIFGLTVNVHDSERTAGGSSGGEGALVGGGGSPLGIGSDLGSSVRAPAAFNGACGLRPTGGRLPLHGQVVDGGGPGVVGPVGTLGLLARSSADIAFVMEKLLDKENMKRLSRDARFVPLIYRSLDVPKVIRVIYYDYDQMAEATPGMRRVVREAAEMLAKLPNFEVKAYLPNHMRDVPVRGAAYSADKGRNWAKVFEQCDVDPIALPDDIITDAIARLDGATSLTESWQLMNNQVALLETKEKLLQELTDVDVMLVPAFACPALKVGYPSVLMKFAMTFSAVFNLLDFPAGVVKMSEENEEDQKNLESYPEFERHANESHYASVVEGLKGGLGLPLAVQVVGKPWNEELVLSVMETLEELRDQRKQ